VKDLKLFEEESGVRKVASTLVPFDDHQPHKTPSYLFLPTMSADPSTEPKVEEDDIFSGLKKKKKSKKVAVETPEETAAAAEEKKDDSAAPEATNEAAAENGEDDMFADLKKK
jgi:hypothetical protein